jgi:hypothetical protein
VDANDKKFFEQEFAIIDIEEKEVNADESESHRRIHIARGLLKAKRGMLERWMAIKSDWGDVFSNQINPPVGKCKTHVDWCVRTVQANPGKLKLHQIITFLSPQIKCNSRDRVKSVGDALSKSLRKPAQLRMDDDGNYWPIENPVRRMSTKKGMHESFFSVDHPGIR